MKLRQLIEIIVSKPGMRVGLYYNIEVKNNNREDYENYDNYWLYKINEDDLKHLKCWAIEEHEIIFISENTGEIFSIPKSKIKKYEIAR